MKRVLFLGQKWVGQSCFENLLARRHELNICGCVTNASTDVWWAENKIWEQAQKHGIRCIDNKQRSTQLILDLIKEQQVDVLLSVQHPWILPQAVLEAVNGQAFNIHNAPLPGYQGHNACNHALLNGENRFCSTLHWMIDSVDEGKVVKEEWFPIEEHDTAWTLYRKGIAAAETLFDYLLDRLNSREPLPAQAIVGLPRFYARHSINDLRCVTENEDPEVVNRKIRAFYFPPFEPAYLLQEANKVYLFPTGAEPYDCRFS